LSEIKFVMKRSDESRNTKLINKIEKSPATVHFIP